MAHINLLPWRETLRKKRQQEFGMMVLGGVLFTILGIIGAHLQIDSEVHAQGQRNAFLQQEIERVEREIAEIRDLGKTKASLLARMNIIQELQSSRPQSVHLMEELVETLPEGVMLNNVKQIGNKIEISGKAQSNARVSSLMRNIENSDWLGNPKLNYIESRDSKSKNKTDDGLSSFQLTAVQVSQTSENEK